ncbi:MAG TPA: amidohydrolase family protein [Stackebrandtia sp.]|uniref:amidohydrolase family protein n=1 Tax=Stackebrandtia sp. TaxID=2023065 RepID=UPI002D303D01|nr:amidohydrolase family protein [Stackebrandtia sp.]HZE38666.1 amidohydrolase family protein [Stackebrandtia sp.]
MGHSAAIADSDEEKSLIIDAHSHVHDPVHDHIALLDEAGVERTVLFGTLPHPERATDLDSFRREMSVLERVVGGGPHPDGFRSAWGQLAAACAAHPDRFIGFGKVRLDLPPERIAEDIERELIGRGFVGIGELTPPPGRAGDIEPVLRAASDHGGMPVVVHGFAPTTAADLATVAGLARRHRDVPVVISQLGGLNWLTAIELARDNANLYLDLSTANIIFAVRLAIREVPDRTMFGSDAPYGDPVLARATVERVIRPGAVRDRVLGGTLARLLDL